MTVPSPDLSSVAVDALAMQLKLQQAQQATPAVLGQERKPHRSSRRRQT